MEEKSYTEAMNSDAFNQETWKGSYLLGLYIDMTLAKALLKAEKAKLMEKIDVCIDNRDKDLFQQLSKQYKALHRKQGT